MFKWITLALAVVGFSVGVWTAATSREELPAPQPDQPPSINPFSRGIAGTGTVEASTRNLALAAPEPGLVTAVWVEVGQKVRSGDALFELDNRPLDAELVRAEAAERLAAAELEKWRAMPRPQDVPPLEAALNRSRAVFEQRKDEWERISAAAKDNAASTTELQRVRFSMVAAEAEMHQAQAELDLVLSGAWDRDVAVAEAKRAAERANIASLKLRKDRLTVRSPIDGTVLKRDIEPGEVTRTDHAQAALTLGNIEKLHVRAQIDEEDAPLLREGAAGKARIRGRSNVIMDLKMVRIEPLAIPKRQLTAVSTELVDTRVIEVVFEITGLPTLSIYPGQLVDVFLEVE